jgi:DNA-binding phage protein
VTRAAPSDFIESGNWPTGRLRRDAPIEVEYAQAIARALTAALEGRAITVLAAEAGVSRSTVHDLLSGVSCGQVATVARLEAALAVRLWPE